MSPSNDSDSSDASDSPLSTMDSHQLSRSGPKGDGGSPGRESLSPDDGSSSTTTPESHDSSSDSGDAMSVDDGPEGPGDEDSDDDADPQSAAQDGKREVGHSKGSAHGPQIRPVGFQAGSAGDLAGLLKMLNADGDEQLEGLKRFEKHARSALAQRNVGGGHGVTLIHADCSLGPFLYSRGCFTCDGFWLSAQPCSSTPRAHHLSLHKCERKSNEFA